MPVDITFLDKILRCLGFENKLELLLFFDFLEDVIQSPSQKRSLAKFIEKWKSCLHKSSRKMLLIKVKGTWPPPCLTTKELLKQQCWNTFVRNYDSSFTECTVNSQDSPHYQPLNFKELITQTLWKEIYENFGNRIVEYIFDKCGILYEVQESLYLFVASPQAAIYKKLVKFQGIKKGVVSRAPASCKFRNPYQLTQLDHGTFKEATLQKENSDPLMNNDVNEPAKKKVKASKEHERSQETKSNSMGRNRWICPKPEILEKVIEQRNAVLRSYKRPISQVESPSNGLRYICVQEDAIFQPHDKCFVIKQNGTLSSTDTKLPRGWEGLHLPDKLTTLVDAKIPVEVFIISETLARKLEIRIKPKGRQRKKKNVASSELSSSSCNNTPPLKLAAAQNSQNSGTDSSRKRKRDHLNPVEKEAPNLKPYSSTHTLPITACLYNRSSWSKWPTSHCLSKAANNQSEAVQTVVDAILAVGVCSEDTQKYLLDVIKPNWNTGDSSNPLNKIILNVVDSHSKFKDIHKLFKNCVAYWRKLYEKKQEKKQQKFKTETAACENDVQIEKEVELIDLNTSSSSSESEAPESQPNAIHVATKLQNRYDLVRKSSGNTIKRRTFKSLKDAVPHNCVLQSVKQIFHIMKLDQLLGSKRNVRGFFKFLRKAIILGGIKSSLHLSELMILINPYEIPFSLYLVQNLAVESFAAKVVTWLFNDYVLVLLKTCFYVTECNFTRCHARFYLRESWISASSRMKAHLIEKGALNKISGVNSRPNAVLRYVPKQNQTLRSLLIMNKTARLPSDKMQQLKLYLHYIDCKINKSRMFFPAALQHKWRTFFAEWKANGSPKLYYLRMDIRDAFPSVSLPKLDEILREAGSEGGRKVLKRYALIGSNGIKRFRNSILNEQNRENWHSGIHIRPCIAMDLEEDQEINSWDILDDITTIINTTNVVKLGKNSYEFHYGLPQGWGPSPILCSIYYGYIDSTLYLPYLESNGRLFLRVVDDYLFISPNANEVLNLMQLMKIGCEKYEIKMNAEKSENNIFVQTNVMTSKNNCETVTFCGWNFCVVCGHVSRDYKKYSGQDFASTITFQMPGNVTSPEEFILLRATVIIPARLKPIVLDPTINCYKRIILTVFEASIIMAFRLYAICRVVYPNLNALKYDDRVKRIKSAIHLCLSRLARHVARSSEYHGPTFSSQEKVSCEEDCCGCRNISNMCPDNVSIKDPLCFESLLFTSLVGFRLKLLKHYEAFDRVFGYLNFSISKLRRKLGDMHCDNIIRIVGTNMPESLSEIQI